MCHQFFPFRLKVFFLFNHTAFTILNLSSMIVISTLVVEALLKIAVHDYERIQEDSDRLQ